VPTACGGSGTSVVVCESTAPASMPPTGDPNRAIEDIIEVLTGLRETGEGDESNWDEIIADPNFGGAWGDFKGGVVVAVIDCSKVDANQLAAIAGGSDFLRLIEVPYTYRQTEEFRSALIEQLAAAGVSGDVNMNSTLNGRFIEVRVPDADELPNTFGNGVPDDAYSIVVTTDLTRPAG